MLDPIDDPLAQPRSLAEHARQFTAITGHRGIKAGHNVPQEAPEDFADAVLPLL